MRITFLFRFGVLAFLIPAALAAPQAQAPADPSAILILQRNQTAQLAATWLHSGDPRMEAWGAYVVLRDKHKELIPDLLALANAYEISDLPVLNTRREQHDAMLATLDALIQLDPAISGGESKRLYTEFPAQSMILLSRAWISEESLNSSNTFLLELFRTEHSQLAWLAAGNILAERRAEGFAAAVVGGMTVHMKLLVTSPNGSMGGSGSSYCGDSFAGPPLDRTAWPEIGTYELAEPGAGATLLAGGADPSYYRRKVGRLYSDIEGGGHCGNVIEFSRDVLRQHYLARMLGHEQDDPPLKASIQQVIVWEDGKAYLACLKDFVQQQQAAFKDVADELKNDQLITEDEAITARPHIEITVVDYREDKTTPLPQAENLGENITVKM